MASPSDLIVITGASGKQCAFLIPLLYGKYPLRLVVNTESSLARLRAKYPEADVKKADLNEPSQCKAMVRDAAVVYHVGPSFHPHETNLGINMVDACEHESVRGAGKFKHFVLSSVHTTQFRKLMNHDNKRYVEEYLYESTLMYTVLKPTDFLPFGAPIPMIFSKEANIWGGMQQDGSVRFVVPWNQDTASAFCDLGDLAEAAAKVIGEREKHFYAEYPLCSTVPVNRRQLAAEIEKITGRKVEVVEAESTLAATNNLLKAMFGDKVDARIRDGAERLITFYDRRGLVGNPNVMRWLLGREPVSYGDYLKAELKKVGY